VKAAALIAALLVSTPALAQDELRFCPNRPDLGASGCTVAPGHVLVEWSALDWQRDDTPDEREDTFLAADLLARFGVGRATELQIGWSPAGRVRSRDSLTGEIEDVHGADDLRVAVRQALGPPDAQGWSLAIEPYVIAPVGKQPIGAGGWELGMVVPATYDVTDRWQAALTTTLTAKPNEQGSGRHFNASVTTGLGYQLSKQVTFVGELAVEQDDDPARHTTRFAGAASIAWQPTKRFQLDLLAVAGLNRNTPDVRVVTGGAILF
jgi:hypothetical protein